MFGEALFADAVERGESADALGEGGVGPAGATGLDRGDHEVLRGVLSGDELEDLGAVTRPFEQHGAEGVGHEFGLALLEDPVTQ